MITVFINGHATQVDPKHTLQDILLLVTQQSSQQSQQSQQSHKSLEQPLRQVQPSNSSQHQFDLSAIAVAHNQHIVPKSQWPQLMCNENDQIELYNAVAGG
jgi:sulfur carrier protein